MGLVLHEEGGIVVARQAADERSVAEALKRFDPDLVLTWELDSLGRQVYEVRRKVGSRVEAPLIRRWTDDSGNPIPLSHALVDAVASQRSGAADPDAHNRAIRERIEREAYEEAYEAARDVLPRMAGKKLSPLHRGVHLRRSRHKPGGRWAS